jgi:hypothetical protein
MNLRSFQWPKRDDEKTAKRWRGSLFNDFMSPILWKDAHYKMLRPPNSVTFPICQACAHIVWEWPHFEEPVPEHAVCEACFEEELAAQERDDLL